MRPKMETTKPAMENGRLPAAGSTRAVLRFEAAAAVFTIALGSALHFVFDWTGGWRPAAVVAAVNESVWEHLKLAFWPAVLWAALARPPRGLRRMQTLAAKGATLPVAAILIVSIFTSYTAILGRNLLTLDIGTFVLAVAAAHALSALLLVRLSHRRGFVRAGLAALALQVLAYGLFTYLPPAHWLFIETRTGVRGIP